MLKVMSLLLCLQKMAMLMEKLKFGNASYCDVKHLYFLYLIEKTR
jgi:hypothetical protein